MVKRLIPQVVACLLILVAPAAVSAQTTTPSEEAALDAYREGAFSRAVQLYTKALSETEDASHRARLQVQIGWTLFALGREGEVGTHLRAALLEDPDLILPDYYTQEFLDLFEAARKRNFDASPEGGPPAPDLEVTIGTVNDRIASGDDLEGALADVDRLIDAYPLDGRLIPLKAQILEILGRTDEAGALVRRHGTNFDGQAFGGGMSVPELILRANRLLDEGDVVTSLELLRRAVSQQPSNVAALELSAEAAQRAANWQEAEFALKSALGLQPDNIGLKLRLGEVYLAKNDPSAARDIFRELTVRFPHSDRAWAALGLLEARLGNRDRALNALTLAVDENPLLPEVQLAKGEILLLEGDVDSALESLNTAANLLQDDAQLEARLGQALLVKGRTEEALVHLRTAVESGFRPFDVQRALSLALATKELYSESERILEASGVDRRGDSEIIRGFLAYQRSEYAEAEEILKPVAQSRAGSPATLNLIAACIYRQARYAEAVTLLDRAHELDPTFPTVTDNLQRARAARDAEILGENAQTVRPAPR
ncbi:MAG: tetratricopeptide repeat protein [Thermoanaerobaculales bacterium]